MLWNPKTADPKVDTTGERLLRAADEMERRGWCAGHYKDGMGRVCLMGALNVAREREANSSDPSYVEAFYRLQNYLGKDPINWNDDICKSKEQAIAALRGAAWMQQ